ncbi:MAG: 16S rRNA (guanine(966)-N(2))-methyltransferase RsmD [Pyrinomonadaceae bacterium]
MRIIAGQYRGKRLKSPSGKLVRPTSDRTRETLFNVLSPGISDTCFLDLCAGTGAVGIEALSRGASFVTFVDCSRKMCALIEENLDSCQVPEEMTRVIMSDANSYLKRLNKEDPRLDLIFFDPPYDTDYSPTLRAIESGKYLAGDGVLIVEHYHKKALPDEVGSIRRWRMIKVGDACLSFYETV